MGISTWVCWRVEGGNIVQKEMKEKAKPEYLKSVKLVEVVQWEFD